MASDVNFSHNTLRAKEPVICSDCNRPEPKMTEESVHWKLVVLRPRHVGNWFPHRQPFLVPYHRGVGFRLFAQHDYQHALNSERSISLKTV